MRQANHHSYAAISLVETPLVSIIVRVKTCQLRLILGMIDFMHMTLNDTFRAYTPDCEGFRKIERSTPLLG